MELSKTMYGLIGIFVAIVVVATLAIPTIGDLTKTSEVFDNSTGEELFQMEEFGNLPSGYTLSYTKDDLYRIQSGNNLVQLRSATIVCATDMFLLRFGLDNSGPYIQSVGLENEIFVNADSGAAGFELKIYKDRLDVYVDGSLVNTVTSSGYAIVKDGSFVMKSSNQVAYMRGDSPIYAMGLSTVAGTPVAWANIIYLHGSISEGVEVKCVNLPAATISNVVVTSEAVSGYDDLFKLSSVSFDFTYNDSTTPLIYDFFIVPENVSVPIDGAMSGTQSTLFGVVPLLLLIVVVMMAVRMISGRRD